MCVFVTYFASKLSCEFRQRVLRVTCEKGLLAKIPKYLHKFLATCEIFQIRFLKGILWDICLLPSSSPKPPILMFLHQNSTKLSAKIPRYPHKFLATCEIFQISFLKGILWGVWFMSSGHWPLDKS